VLVEPNATCSAFLTLACGRVKLGAGRPEAGQPVEGLSWLEVPGCVGGVKIEQRDFVNSKSYLYSVLLTAFESKNAKQRGIVDKSRGGGGRLTKLKQ
jgi:hypothetical protein